MKDKLLDSAVFSNVTSCIIQELCSDRNYKIAVIKSGESILRVSQKVYSCKAPCIVFLGISEPYIFDIKSNIYERYIISLSPRGKADGIPELFKVFDACRPEFSHVVSLNGDAKFICEISESIVDEVSSGELSRAEIWTSALLCRALKAMPPLFLPSSQKERVVTATRKTIEQDPSLPFDLDDLATDNYISRFYLSHIFSDVTGTSIKSYILCCRLALACTLLCSPNTPIGKVAELSGFADMSNFSRYFKDIVGVTPTQYRNLSLSDK